MFDHSVNIEWRNEYNNSTWVECCELIIQVFGLPGNRFICSLHSTHIEVIFKSYKDAIMCKIMLSEKNLINA